MRLETQMVSELDLHRPLNQTLRQLRKQPARPDDLLLAASTSEQPVDHFIRKNLPDLSRHLAHTGRNISLAPPLDLWLEHGE